MKSFGLLALLVAASPFALLLRATPAVLPAVNIYTVADGGGSDTNPCTRQQPCSTIEVACSKVPDDVARPYIIHVGAGTYTAGCHLVGKRQVKGEDWASPGSITVRGATKTYGPADGGTGRGLLGWVTAGSAGTRDVWGFDGGTYNADELKGKWVEVTSGTGADTTRRWPITTNQGDRMTIGGVSGAVGPTTAPAAGSAYRIVESDTIINGDLADTIKPVGFPPQTAIGAAFVVGGNVKGFGNESAAPPISIENFKFGSSASRGVLFNGPVAFRENECATTTSSCFRGLDGTATVAAERNIITAGTFLVAGSTSNGSHLPLVQLYNNFSNGTVTNLLGAGQVGQLLTAQNEFTTSADAIRVNSIQDGVSRYDKITTAGACVRSPLNAGASGIGSGLRMDFTAFDCTGTGTYSINLASRDYLHFDADSQVTSANHHASLTNGAQIWWASGATWDGAGGDTFVFTDTANSLTEAGVTSGAVAKYQCMEKGACVGIPTHSGDLYTPVVAPAGTTSGADGQTQFCAGTATATTGVASVTFADVARCAAFSSAPACSCTEQGDAGTPVACGHTAISATAVTFVGDITKGTSTIRWMCAGPK